MTVPTQAFLTSGIGVHKDKLTSFELALREAQIEKYNLVAVSSILPPHCRILNPDLSPHTPQIPPGSIVHCVLSRNSSDEDKRLLSASVGIATPTASSQYGYISEHHAFGQGLTETGDYAEDLAASMLATTLGIPFNADTAWSERENVYRASGQIFQTTHCTRVTNGSSHLWTTIITALVFYPPKIPLGLDMQE